MCRNMCDETKFRLMLLDFEQTAKVPSKDNVQNRDKHGRADALHRLFT